MSFDGLAEQEAILARARQFCGGRIYDGLVDDVQLAKDTDGGIKPYVVVWFGELTDVSNNDRSIAGEEQQPATMPVLFDVWASTSTHARQVAGALRASFRGWRANDNMGPMVFRGGGSFQFRDSTALSSRFERTITMETTINYSVDPTVVVAP